MSVDSYLLATASSDRTARIWDIGSNQELFPLIGHKDEVRQVAFSGDRKRLVTLGMDNAMKVWNIAPNGELRCWSESAQISALSADGRFMIVGRKPDRRIVDLIAGTSEPMPESSKPSDFIAISGDGRFVAHSQLAFHVAPADRMDVRYGFDLATRRTNHLFHWYDPWHSLNSCCGR